LEKKPQDLKRLYLSCSNYYHHL